MPPTKICDKDVPQCVTIDASQNKALDNARVAFPNAGSHPDSGTAVDQLIACLKTHPGSKTVMVIGHGKMGKIIAGGGRDTTEPAKYIGYDNETAWIDSLVKLAARDLKEIVFCSCNTGAGDTGAQLVYDVAQKAEAPTYAFSGVITLTDAGDFNCQKLGAWQLGDPAAPIPAPAINPPPPSLLVKTDMEIEFFHGDEYQAVRSANVSLISYFKSNFQGRGPLITSLAGRDTERLLSLINFSDHFEMEGEPLAIVTGEFEIEYRLDGKRTQKSLILYNDLFVRDAMHPSIYYNASQNLAGGLLDLVALRL